MGGLDGERCRMPPASATSAGAAGGHGHSLQPPGAKERVHTALHAHQASSPPALECNKLAYPIYYLLFRINDGSILQ